MRTSKKISILICLALCFVALLALTACTGGGGSTEGEHVHTEEIIPGVEATCTEDGLTEGKKCSDCGEILVEQKKKDAVGKHKFENSYTCTLCNTEIYKESQGLLFEISGDNTYYIVVGIGDCADTEIVIPYTHEGLPVLAIGDSAFLNRNIITAVIIPESVTTIGNSAFSGCVALVSVSIPDSVNEIRSNAFSGCILLEIVTIGSNVSIIGDNAFSNCDKLEIYCEQQSKPDGWSESWNTSSRPVSWEHTHTEEIIPAVESTCSKEGLSEGKKCSDCGKILLEQKPLRKKDHTEKKVPAVEPTCYKSGLTEGIKCSVCGEVLVAQETIAPHKEEIIPAVEPTCTETGLTEGKKCADCGKILEPQEIIAPHKEEIIPAVAATCTQTGLTEGKKCADCGEILVEQKVVPMGHKLENSYTCTLCGIEIYKESQGLEFEISKDGTYYVLSGLGDCTDTDIVIPYTHEGLPVKDIHYTTFQKNASITSIIIPSSITSISGGSFNYCSSLTSVRIPNSVTLMGYDVFRGCVTLTIYCEPTSKPQGWDKYWNETNCPVVWNSNNNDIATDGNVYTVIDGVRYAIKDGVATVARQSSNIASATISSSITYRGINYNVTGIDENAFYDCSSLTKISIPNSIVSIGDKAFYGCPLLEYNEYDNAYYLGNEENPCVALMKAKDTNITSCTINENTNLIYDYAFNDCNSLAELVIPNSVASFGKDVFFDCTALTIYCETESEPSTWSDSVVDGHYWSNMEKYLSCPVVWDCNNNDKTIDGKVYTVIDGVRYMIEDGKATIVRQPKNIVSITIPSSIIYKDVSYNVKSIDKNAFFYCDSLTEIVIPSSIGRIGKHAFDGCYSLTIYCEARNETMAWESSWNSSSCPVVMDCNNKDVASDGYIYTVIDGIRYAIKDGVAMVARQPKNIVSAIIPTRITYKGNNYKVTSIGRSAFYECDSLKKVEIPSSIESIDTGAFSKCNGLTKIFIHSYVESVSVSAFRDCDNLTIYCEAQSKPTDWHSGWNFSSIIPVKWGHTHSYTGGECICGKTR